MYSRTGRAYGKGFFNGKAPEIIFQSFTAK